MDGKLSDDGKASIVFFIGVTLTVFSLMLYCRFC